MWQRPLGQAKTLRITKVYTYKNLQKERPEPHPSGRFVRAAPTPPGRDRSLGGRDVRYGKAREVFIHLPFCLNVMYRT